MRSTNSHLSLILALISILATFQFLSTIVNMVSDYEQTLAKEYSIVAISKEVLTIESLRSAATQVNDVQEIDPTFMIESLKENLSAANQAYLKTSLPKFYKIKLDRYPSTKELEKIKSALLKIKSIEKIETFAQTQNKIFSLLSVNKIILLVISLLVFIVSILLMIRQIEVWRFQHNQRIKVMSIFGASGWHKSSHLIKIAIIDSIISSSIVGGFFYYITQNISIKTMFEDLGIENIKFDYIDDGGMLLIISLILSISCVIYVAIKAKE